MPEVENISVEALENKDITIHLKGSRDALVFEITKQPTHGAFALDPKSGHLQYRGEKGWHGIDHITYIASDKDGMESTPADVVIDVKSGAEYEKVAEITLEVPVKPDAEDLLDIFHIFVEELEEIITGRDNDDDGDDD